MSLGFHKICLLSSSSPGSSLATRLSRNLKLIALALLCGLPFGAAFLPAQSVMPYLALVAFVPAMYVIRRLNAVRDIIGFAVLCSMACNVLITYWLPNAIKDSVSTTTLISVLVAVPLWGFWCLGMSVFLVVYRYFYSTHLWLVGCAGVLLLNYWPSIFGVNPFLMLMHAGAISGAAFFIGTAGVEWLAILISAYFASALAGSGRRPARRAAFLLATLFALDGASALYLNSAPSQRLNVALVQANNVFSKKLSSAEEVASFAQEIINDEGPRPDLVVFPESVFTFNMKADPESATTAIEALKRISQEQDVAFLLSLVEAQTFMPGKPKTSKVTSLLVNEGQEQGRADKARTIPFAEYTPEWAVPLINRVGAHVQMRPPGTEYSPMRVKGIRIIPLTCFESLDQALVERRLDGGTGLLVNQSSLDTFGAQGQAPYQAVLWQHMSYEQRWVNQWQVPVARALLSGGSTVISAGGKVDLTALKTSWGREVVKGHVAIREPMPLDGLASGAQMGVRGLILLLAGGFLFFCVIKAFRRRARVL